MAGLAELSAAQIDKYGEPMFAVIPGEMEGNIGDQNRGEATIEDFTGFVIEIKDELQDDGSSVAVTEILMSGNSPVLPVAGMQINVRDVQLKIRFVTTPPSFQGDILVYILEAVR